MFTLLFLAACAPKVAPSPEPAPTPPPLPAYAQALKDAMDPRVSACEDFYQYACGGWLKTTPLPADKPSWTRSFSQIREDNLSSMREVLDAAVKDPGTDAEKQKVAQYYGSCMDEARIDAAGVTPLAPFLADINTVKDVASFVTLSGKLSAVGVTSVLSWDYDSDFKNPEIIDLFIYPSGLSLPDREYYRKTDDASKVLITALEAHIAAMLVRTGAAEAAAKTDAAAILSFEKQLAEATWPRSALRDPEKIFNKVDKKGLEKTAPKLGFSAWLKGLGAEPGDNIVATAPEVFKKYEAILAKTNAATLRAYLRWQLIHATAGALDSGTYNAEFAFFGKQVLGQQEPEARWKRCVGATNLALGEAAAKVWITSRFPGDSKTIALDMIGRIEGAFKAGLPKLAWMDDETRRRAGEKTDMIVNKIGYPDAWRDYSKLKVVPDQYATNLIAARKFETERRLAKLGKPVDKSEWFMTPQMVNAYYNSTWNEMVFPAGILQPPFFKNDYPVAMNYGAIGMVMGHELSHGFDDDGRKFDGGGRMVEWWAPEVAKGYEERAACVQSQYDAYEVAPGLNVNGELTLGENIADLGGLRVSYRAFQDSLGAGGNKAEIPGLTEDQVFFVSFAQGWCNVASPEYQKMLVLSDTHSPAMYRVNGPASNLPEFAAAFGCQAGSKMVRAPACEVW